MLIELQDLGKSFGEHEVLCGINAGVEKGDRIGIIGANGTGKTTLLRILCGQSQPDTGSADFAAGATCGYLEQTARLDPALTVYDTMKESFRPALDAMARLETLQKQLAAAPDAADVAAGIEHCTAVIDAMDAYNMDTQIRKMLSGMGFPADTWQKTAGVLSGGEQTRLRLAGLLLRQPDILILDEPTNHLDIQSREWIEEAVEEYEGNLLFVSHDRYFIDRFASRIWMLEDGHITDFRGNYQEYQAARARGAAGKSASDVQVSMEKAPEPKEKKEKPKRPGGTKNLEKEVTAAERAVAKAEEQMYDLEQQIQEAAADYLKLQELYEQREALEEEILKLYGTWETLSAQLEEARG